MTGKFNVRKDRVLVVDFELTCWVDAPPVGQKSEIIEIGIAEVDVPSLEIIKTGSYYVKPEYSTVSDYCTELTGITQRKVDKQGRKLSEVSNVLKKNWGSSSKAWLAWGNDRQSIMIDTATKDVENPFSEAYHNIGQQFSMMAGATSSIGLNKAISMMGIKREGKEHSADGDAYDTARLWIHLMKKFRNDLLPQENLRFEETEYKL